MLLWLRNLIACRKCQFRTRVSGLNPTFSLSATLPVITACSPISSELTATLTPELIRKKPKTSSMMPQALILQMDRSSDSSDCFCPRAALRPRIRGINFFRACLSSNITCNHTLHAHADNRSEEHTSELQSRGHLVCRLLLV